MPELGNTQQCIMYTGTQVLYNIFCIPEYGLFYTLLYLTMC